MEFLPRPSQKLEIKIALGPLAGTYSTYVEEVDNHGFTVAAPMMGSVPLTLSSGMGLRVEYTQTGARISYNTRVLRAELTGEHPLVRLAVPDRSEVERIQLRDFVRQEASVDMTFKVLSAPDSEQNPRPDVVIRSRTRDISGSGALIMCPEPYPARTQLEVNLNIEGKSLRCLADVIRATQQISDREWWVAIRFVGLQERDRDLIIRFIFNVQRELRRKGLLGG